MWIIQALPSGGIYIFASQLHTHLAGRGVRTVLVRGGSELEVVQEDQHFSAHYQVSLSRYQFTRRARGRGLHAGPRRNRRHIWASGGLSCWQTQRLWCAAIFLIPLFKSPSKSGATLLKKRELFKCISIFLPSADTGNMKGLMQLTRANLVK